MIGYEEKQAVIDLFPFMGDNPVVFDVGSNKGHFSDIILDEFLETCENHLFEPNEKLLSFTQIKYEYKKNVVYNNSAVCERMKDVDFYYFENYHNEISSLFKDETGWDGLPVKIKKLKSISIDNYCIINKIKFVNYIKLDIEGAEMPALYGMSNLMSDGMVGIIQVEYSEHWSRAAYSFSDLMYVSNKFGYKIYKYEADNFWEVITNSPAYDNYYLTKHEIHNYSVGGWNNHFILSTIDLQKFDLILEVGAFEGLTTKYMCENMLNEGGRAVVVDPLFDYYVKDDPRYHPEFKHQYQRFVRNTRGLPVELKRGKSEDELPKLNELRFDFCFVDGNHYPDWPYFDGCWCFAITKVGGYILFDDYNIWDEETKQSIDKFLQEFGGSLQIIKDGYQVLVQKTQNQYNDLTFKYYH